MSIFEFFVVIIVGLLVLKPEDVPQVIEKFKEVKLFFSQAKREIKSSIESIPEFKELMHSDDLESDSDQMNTYLEKIANLGSVYEGEYSLISIRNHYNRIIQKELDRGKKTR